MLGRCDKCGEYSVDYSYHFEAYKCTNSRCQHLDRETPSPKQLKNPLKKLIEQDKYGVLREDIERIKEREMSLAARL